MIRLVIADVDGTLVTQEKVLTKEAIAAAQELRDAGITLALTSGRPPRGMQMLIEPLRLEGQIAGFNGGVYVNPDMSVVASHLLAPEVAKRSDCAHSRQRTRRLALHAGRVARAQEGRAPCGARGVDGEVRGAG